LTWIIEATIVAAVGSEQSNGATRNACAVCLSDYLWIWGCRSGRRHGCTTRASGIGESEGKRQHSALSRVNSGPLEK
jgi:hypothetical protein